MKNQPLKIRLSFTSGFTLIELLVVIAIIGILTGLIGSNYITSRARARDAQRKNDLRQIQNALEMFHNDNGYYPTSTIAPGGNQKINPFRWGVDAFSDIEPDQPGGNHPDTIYVPVMPGDPSAPGTQYYYEVDGTRTKYRLCAQLTNEEDSDIQQEYTDKVCSETTATTYCNYCVSSSNTTLTENW